MDISLAIKNFPKQASIFKANEKYKYVIVTKGRRFGLTRGAANNLITEALEGKYKQALWVDTINSNIDRYIERYFVPYLLKLPKTMWNWRKVAKMIVINDSIIDFRSADIPESIEGFGYDKFFLNEAGIILKDEYLYQNAIRPMLWEYPKCRGVIGGTPKGRGLFYELYQRGENKEQKDYKAFKFTTFDNPYLNSELIKEEIKTMPEKVCRQEVYGEFLEGSGLVFDDIGSIMTSKPQKPQRSEVYCIGVDLARTEDFTAISVFNRKKNNQVYFYRARNENWESQMQRIEMVSKSYNNSIVYIDATGLGNPIVEELIRRGIACEPINLTNETKKQIIEKSVLWTEQKMWSLIKDEIVKREYDNFTYDILPSGKIRYSAPIGQKDDTVVANALACWGLIPIFKKERKKKTTPIREHYKSLVEALEDGQEDYIEY